MVEGLGMSFRTNVLYRARGAVNDTLEDYAGDQGFYVRGSPYFNEL
jgi:hypothetical protein